VMLLWSYGSFDAPKGEAHHLESGLPAPKAQLSQPQDRAEVAVLLAVGNEESNEKQAAIANLNKSFTVICEEKITFFGQPRQLFILKPLESGGCCSDDLKKLHAKLADMKQLGNPLLWPLHHMEFEKSLKAIDDENTVTQYFGLWQANQVTVIGLLQANYGADVAYSVSWVHIFTRSVWILALISFVGLIAGASPQAKHPFSQNVWLLMLLAFFLWAAHILWRTAAPHDHPLLCAAHTVGEPEGETDADEEPLTFHQMILDNLKRLWIIVLPCTVYVVLVTCLLLSIFQLKLWVAYDWGDCINLRNQGKCIYATTKHGFNGWLANVGCNLILALVFLFLGPLSRRFSSTLAQNMSESSKIKSDQLAILTSVTLEVLAKVGTFVILGTIWAPKWVEVEATGPIDCSQQWGYAIFGKSWSVCLHNQLSAAERRESFEESLVGPLVVAPLLIIVFKLAIPYLTYRLDWLSRNTFFCTRACDACCDAVARLLALLFAYDGSFVGGCAFVSRGWPFKAEGSDEPKQKLSRFALEQGARKSYDPLADLLFMKLSWFWALFFLPIVPWGVFPALACWILEANKKLEELILLHRRPFPHSLQLIHRTLHLYQRAVLILAVNWWACLLMLTYNDKSYRLF